MKDNKPDIRQLFSDMAVNDKERVDVSGLLKWLAGGQNRISSIFDGKWVSDGKSLGKFPVGGEQIELVLGSAELIERAISRIPGHPIVDTKESMDDITSRLEKSIGLLEREKMNLQVCESLATNIPLWQIQEWDDVNWSCVREKVKNRLNLVKDVKICLLSSNGEEYSLERLLADILVAVVRYDDHSVILLSSSLSGELGGCLPISYLVDVLNKSGIRKAPIDLILVDAICEKSWESIRKECGKKQVLAFGDLSVPKNMTRIQPVPFYGVYRSKSYLPGAHYIVDSTADVATAVDAITGNVWSSGVQVNHRYRPLVFVHEPKYKETIDLAMAKMGALNVVSDATIKTADFVIRPNAVAAKLGQFGELGKVLYGGGGKNFSFPSLVYDVGTSSELVASPPAGSGHVLVVIPFRNVQELLTLTNNFDPNKQVFIFTSDVSFLKRVSIGLKASTIVTNTCVVPKHLRECPSLNMYILREESDTDPNSTTGTQSSSSRAALGKTLETGVKALSTWRSTRISERLSYVQKFLAALISNGLNVVEEDMMRLEKQIMNIIGHFNPGHPSLSSSGSMSFEDKEPMGFVGLVYSNPESLDPVTCLLPLVMSVLMGNVSLVMSICSATGSENCLDIIYKTCSTVLPVGVVSFGQFNTMEETLDVLAATSLGKLNTLWAIYPNSKCCLTPLKNYQVEAYNRVIIHTQTNSVDTIALFKFSAYLEQVKLISL